MAVYDIESTLFGTALGVNLEQGMLADGGHENHMRAINGVRSAGGIAELVKRGTLTRGSMHACVKGGVEFLLTGSIRDDGALAGVITDSLEAQRARRDRFDGVALALRLGGLERA